MYCGASLRDGRAVSLKIFRNNLKCVESGLGEYRMHVRIRSDRIEQHHSIVTAIECFYTRGRLVIASELLGSSLLAHYTYLETIGCRVEYYNVETIRIISAQMLDALHFLHDIGITHCDVKTANICIADAKARQFKLIDFNAAVLEHDVHTSYQQSRWYRAPEVMLGCVWGAKVDIWSLGCVLAELLLGYVPFRFPSMELVLAAQRASLGPFPHWMLFLPLARMFLTPSGVAYEIDPQHMPPGAYSLAGTPDASLAAQLKARVDTGAFDGVEAFLGSLLTLDPNERPTAAEAIQHEWIMPHVGRNPWTATV